MSRIGTRFGTRLAISAAAAGGLATAFFALTPTASADTAAPIIPGLPGGMNVVQQLANAPAMASQLLQNAANMLQPATTSPVSPSTLPGMPATYPATSTAPVSAPMTSMVGTVPGATPAAQSPLSSIPLLNQLGLPSNLPLPGLGSSSPTPAVPGQPALPPSLNPFSALP
jgi:hypothetical protein